MSGTTFKVTVPVRFADCDPAGIVFYPRYFEMINGVVEDWFAEALDWSFTKIVKERNEGLPTVNIDCQFLSTSRMGERLDFELSLIKLGKSSCTVVIEAFNQGNPVLRASHVLVYTSQVGGGKSLEIPRSLRQRMTSYLATENRSKEASANS